MRFEVGDRVKLAPSARNVWIEMHGEQPPEELTVSEVTTVEAHLEELNCCYWFDFDEIELLSPREEAIP